MTDRTDHPHLKRKLLWLVVIAMVVVVGDLVVKGQVTSEFGPAADEHSWWLVGNDIGLQYVRNTGAAFGLLQGNAELLAALSVVVVVGLVWLIFAEMTSDLWKVLASGLLLGGAIGNLIERVRDGYVTDYIAVGPWPRFNLADSAITLAVSIFVVWLFFTFNDQHVDADSATPDDRPSSEGIQRDGYE